LKERDTRELGGAWTRFQRISAAEPSPDLAPFVERYWTVEWNYAEPYRQLIVPFPQVHVTVMVPGGPRVSGVSSRFGVQELVGSGRVVGAAFRPGGFRPFLDGPVSALTDRTVPPSEVGLAASGPLSADVAGMEAWLRAALPEPDPLGLWVGEVVAAVAADPAIARVDQLAARFDAGVRRLQRLFAEYVGVGPKWVIRRYRLREVTDRMERGDTVDWAGLAADLGYADQAHLTRDFTAMFGEPPTRYAARYPSR
jgi:AraC-like DNA-binding protein